MVQEALCLLWKWLQKINELIWLNMGLLLRRRVPSLLSSCLCFLQTPKSWDSRPSMVSLKSSFYMLKILSVNTHWVQYWVSYQHFHSYIMCFDQESSYLYLSPSPSSSLLEVSFLSLDIPHTYMLFIHIHLYAFIQNLGYTKERKPAAFVFLSLS